MRTIIAGSRWITDVEVVRQAVAACPWTITEVVSGRGRGVDEIGELLAAQCKVPVKPFPADWDKFGRVAGPIRNQQMADYAEALIAVWDGVSRGTGDMIKKATQRGLRLHVHRVGSKP